MELIPNTPAARNAQQHPTTPPFGSFFLSLFASDLQECKCWIGMCFVCRAQIIQE